jgi:glutamate synthase (NADPH/NADH) large chain
MSVGESMPRAFDYHPAKQGLYDPKQEKDACGVGMIADLKGMPTRQTIAGALDILVNLDHRGARGCDEGTGDGAGILCSTPDAFFRRVLSDLPQLHQYAVGNIFFSKGSSTIGDAKRLFEEFAKSLEGVRVAGWRKLPTCNESLGKQAKTFEPHVEQVIVHAEGKCLESVDLFAATLYTLRQAASRQIGSRLNNCSFYVCSLNPKTICYKGMLTPEQVPLYFPDLLEEDFQAHVAVVHSRFATNTFPSWDKAHPYRLLAHNGEINTIQGNCNWMRAREQHIKSEIIPDIESTFPLFSEDQSDTSRLDSVMECLHLSGRPLTEVVCLMVPQAWEKFPDLGEEMRDWFKMQAAVMEPWDGPACLCFTDSNTAGACLDRNGLRPCRYYLTKDQRLIVSSEAGVVPDIHPDDVAEKGRLLPGQVMSVDFKEHRLYHNDEIKQTLASKQSYGQWIREEGFTLDDVKPYAKRPARKFSWSAGKPQWGTKAIEVYRESDPSDQGLRAFGYTQEALEMLLKPMAEKASEAMGSMGNDTPLACLSDLPRPVFDFFYQRFAQVSNPPLDPIRETIVMSLSAWIGPEQNLLAPLSRVHCRRLWLDHPCLLPSDMNAIYGIGGFRGWNMHTVDTTFPVAEGTRGLQRHLVRVCNEACDAIRFGRCQIIVLSDRSVSRDRAPIPSLLCAGAVHQALVREKLRLDAAIVSDSGEPFEVHHHCLLITFGADAVCPYNAYEALLKISKDGMLAKPMEEDKIFENYKHAIGFGMLKVMAKMASLAFKATKELRLQSQLVCTLT